MADAAVGFLLEKLHGVLKYNFNLIKDVKSEVEQLKKDLEDINDSLKESPKKSRKDERFRKLFREIRDVAYEAEDIIDTFEYQDAASQLGKKRSICGAFKNPVQLINIAKKVEKVRAEVRNLFVKKATLDTDTSSVGGERPEEPEAPVVREDKVVVGFDDEAKKLIEYLNEESQQLDVISIIGMPGLGKTTLAGKIFHDSLMKLKFHTRIWVYISQEFTKKDVFIAILKELTTVTNDMYQKTDKELAQQVASELEERKFLIVMDDVWTTEDWDKLQNALPKSNTMGKVLITSRHEEVARYASRSRVPHKLRFLTQEESWLLLKLEVFGKPESPPELKDLGNLIAKQCGGLPLAIVIIGGILVKKFSASNQMSTANKKAWENVSQCVSKYINDDPERRMEKIISLSYDKLPVHLRPCFLYLGMFPEDFEIPVWKLIRMWLAEGFIPHKIYFSREETAESYLDDLISRNLVRIDKIKPDGKVKTCRIHDMLRDFCKTESSNERENFLQEIKMSTDGDFYPLISDIPNYHRLCIHSNILKFLSKEPKGPHVRSFVCFSKEQIDLRLENCSAIPAAFKLLRVLDVKPIRFTKIPSDLYQLVLLRHIVLSCTLTSLPAAFSKLWNIQTLIVDTTSRTLEIKADIWKWTQLRYLKTNASATLPKGGKSNNEDGKLQTLGTISPQNCTEEVFGRASNLKKLGIRGRLSLLVDGKTGSFDSLRKLSNLEKLKLVNDAYPHAAVENKLSGLPLPREFLLKLRILTLFATHLDWSQMSILGLLENLEMLKLKDKAFMGKKWVAADGGFHKLVVLHIGHTDLVTWEASAHHFPTLGRLELRNCEELQEVPYGLADISSFQLLDLHRTELAATSAKKILEAKQTIEMSEFKLSIFPPN